MAGRYQGKYVKKRPPGKGGGILIMVFLVLFAAMAAFGGWKYFTTQKEYDAGADAYASLAVSAVTEGTVEETVYIEAEIAADDSEASAEPIVTETRVKTGLQVDFDLLRSVNSHTVAWIAGGGGSINYPVVQTTDNEYYLDHLFDGTANRNGSIFADFRNTSDFSDRNTFVYGHNMRNGSMFASLSNYAEQSYYDQYPTMTLVTPEGSYSLQVFSGYVTPGNSDIYQLEFRDDQEFESYLERIRLLSDFTSDVAVTAQDRIVTLSTCTYDYEDARYVLHCRLVPMQ